MQRARGILASLRLVKSLRPSITRPIHFQVTRYSYLFPCFSPSLSTPSFVSAFLYGHQNLYFSSKPSSFVELILANEWSEEIEKELEGSNLTPTHETVLYILKKLDKEPEKAWCFFNWVSVRCGFKPSASMYSLLLRIFGQKASMKEFWLIIKKMRDEGFDIDKETYLTILGTFNKEKMASEAAALTQLFSQIVQESATDSVVKLVLEIVLASDWSDGIEKKLGELKLSLSENTVLRVLKELRGQPLKALKFFDWAGKQQDLDYKHNAVTYNAIIRVLGREESIEEFWKMIKVLRTAGHDVDLDSYIKLSRQFQKSKMMKDAVELYELMMDGPYKPSIQDCSVLLRQISLTAKPDLDLVFRVVKKYEATGHSLSKSVYDGIHRSLTSVGRFDEAERILESMKVAGYEPDNITYSQVVFGLCKARRLEEACKVLDEMEKKGCVPDLKTWTILIQGHCTAGEVDKALACFAKMIGKSCDADADLLEIMVNGMCSKKKVVGAYTLAVEMVEKARLRPWQATYKNLIQRLLGEGKLEEALNLLVLMKKHNFPPFPEPFIDYISKFGTVEDAKEFLKALSIKKYPSSSAYLHVFRSFFREGRHSEAQDLLYMCPHHIRNHADILNLFGSTKRCSGTA
ncbi:PREDICTED: pentatricopeptide repeat-containing protein At3g48250, chloroplastic [Nelumbo nucifera]|uniref:Pentatricopeptide repeat-containing protein At3g48250, chloroplastic n=1 Tax=Nelumbo nucifera TaxID=4432 RepID=A0A1U7ZE06_NELNU|nr:PREDICTED: pentatricopeptide repeat-containing protein At3g48250, chloroplastic [Nelumbo nucifera]